MARKIVLTSGKGGVGKTTICANLGATLAELGFRVCLIDVDIGLNNLDVVMGIEKRVMFDIVDVIQGRCRAKQALVQDYRIPSLYVMPSAHSYSQSVVSGEKIKKVIEDLDASFDYIFIDCPAGVEAGFHRAVYCANEAIVVVTPHISSVRDADKVLSILAGYDLIHKSIIINRIRGDMVLNGEMLEIEEIVRVLKTSLLGVVPEDDEITVLSSVGGLALKSSSARAFSLLAENLHEGTKKIYDCTLKYRGFFGNIKRNLKRKI